MVKALRGTDTGSWDKMLGEPHIIAIPDSGFDFPSRRAILTRIMQCAVKRRRFSVWAKPTRQLSRQPVVPVPERMSQE